MKVWCFPKNVVNALLFSCLTLLMACKTSSSSRLDAVDGGKGARESAWFLVPNLQNIFGSGIVDKTYESGSAGEASQICLYFNNSERAQSATGIQPDMFQLWLKAGEFCGEWETPGEAGNQHQFLGAQALAIKALTDTAWVIYLGDIAIGSATVDVNTGLPLIQSLCSGSEYAKACRIETTARSIRVVSAK